MRGRVTMNIRQFRSFSIVIVSIFSNGIFSNITSYREQQLIDHVKWSIEQGERENFKAFKFGTRCAGDDKP